MQFARAAPAAVAYPIGRVVAGIAHAALTNRRAILLNNLSYTAPNASLAERRRLVRNTFRYIADCQVDLYRLIGGSPNEVPPLADIQGLEHVDAARQLGVTAHLGNYEIGAAVMAALGYPVHGVVEDVEPEILTLLEKYRTATGMRTISRNRGARDAYRVLRSGEILLLVADRVIGDVSDGVEVPFCDGRRAVPRGPAQLALAARAPVVVGFAVRTPHAPRRYRITLEPPIMPDGTEPDAVLPLTRRIADRLTAAVRAHPDQWFVFQPGWITGER
jgi:KDO2-lipid IV(A) lauroyltransferase